MGITKFLAVLLGLLLIGSNTQSSADVAKIQTKEPKPPAVAVAAPHEVEDPVDNWAGPPISEEIISSSAPINTHQSDNIDSQASDQNDDQDQSAEAVDCESSNSAVEQNTESSNEMPADFCGNRYLYENGIEIESCLENDGWTIPPEPIPPRPVQPGDNGCCAPPDFTEETEGQVLPIPVIPGDDECCYIPPIDDTIWITGDDVCDTPEVMAQLEEELALEADLNQLPE